jgi:high-affinity iron transporter
VRVLDAPMWHTGRILSEDSSFGDVLHSFFGYSDAPTPLQLMVYVAYLAIVIAAFLGLRAAPRIHHKKSQPAIES